MSSLLLPRRFYSQPQGAVSIDWSNPLANGLINAFNGSSLNDLVDKNKKIVLAGTGAITATDKGLALTGTGDAAVGTLDIKLSQYDAVTVSALVNIQTSGTAVIFETSTNYNLNTGAFGIFVTSTYFELGFNLGSIMLAPYYARPNNGWHFITVVIYKNAAYYGDRITLFIDGVKIVPLGWHNVTNGTYPFYDGLLYVMSRGNTSIYMKGSIAPFFIHGIALSDDEAITISANPWQIFKVSE